MYLARDIPAFVMYCVNGESGSSLLIESTDSMIIVISAWFTICRVAMRRGATGFVRVVSRRANLAAVSSQILENRSRCAASSGDSALFITWYSFYSSEDGREAVLSFTNFALYLGRRRIRHRRSVWVRAIFRRRRQRGEFHNFLYIAFGGCLPRQGNERTASTSFSSVHFTLRNSL